MDKDQEGFMNTGSDPDKIISIPDGGGKPLTEVRMSLQGALNRIHNWVTSAKGQDLDATDAATLEAIGDALQDGINYCDHVDKAITVFAENFGKELFTDV